MLLLSRRLGVGELGCCCYYHHSSSSRSSSTNPSTLSFNTLCSTGRLKEALKKYRVEIWLEPSLFSSLVHSCAQLHLLSPGRQLHSLIITSGASSHRFISNHLLNFYSKLSSLPAASALFSSMPRTNIMSSNILINAFINHSDLDGARKVFDNMPRRNVASWNALITSFVEFERNLEGIHLVSLMHRSGFSPDHFTMASALRACAGIKSVIMGEQVHAHAFTSGFRSDMVVGTSLSHMYMKTGRITAAESVIFALPFSNAVVFNTLISGRSQNGLHEEALLQYNVMKRGGVRPDEITFVSVLSSCSEMATEGQGRQIHAEAVKAGAGSVSLCAALVSMYSRCGCLEDCRRAFSERGEVDTVLWSAMITAYGFHGRGEEAVDLFRRMESRFEANHITFLGLLYACSHSGLKDEGVAFFESMKGRYGLEPKLEHYTCMVDLLGRCGLLDRAEAMAESMPVESDAVIWKTLLSSCRTHKNEEMGARICERIVELDGEDSASYVLRANIHAGVGRWEEVSRVRREMKERGVKKEPGVSWVELRNKVYVFHTGDTSHPKWKEIVGYLEEMGPELRVRGYVPDTGSVSQDTDLEEKEYNLTHHSEKLAVVFGILYGVGNAPLRVMKNLRICNDCHSAIKIISDIRRREIVVRDASRFHHFKNGICSCADFW